MIEKGNQFGVYSVRKIVRSRPGYTSCLTQDPFLRGNLLLNIFSTSQPIDSDRRRSIEKKLELLFRLEHPSLAPVYDSGFVDNHFYCTTNYNHHDTLAERLPAGLSVDEMVKILDHLCDVLAYAEAQKVPGGQLTVEQIFFAEDKRPVIVDFGIDATLKTVLEDTASEPLSDDFSCALEALFSCMLDAYDKAFSGVKRDERLQRLVEIFQGELTRPFQSYAELKSILAELLPPSVADKPAGELVAFAPPVPAQEIETGQIDLRQRSELLPHIRQLIGVQNHLEKRLKEALLEKNKVENQLSKALQTIENTPRPVAGAAMTAASPWKGRVIWGAVGIALGLVLSVLGGVILTNFSPENLMAQSPPEPASMTAAAAVTTDPVDVAPALAVAVATIVAVDPPVASIAEPPIKPVLAEQHQEKQRAQSGPVAKSVKHKRTQPLLNPETTLQLWWPAGQEFSDPVLLAAGGQSLPIRPTRGQDSALSEDMGNEIMSFIHTWSNAWETRDISSYLDLYSESYRPGSGLSREQWAQERHVRLLRPAFISLQLHDPRIDRLDEKRVRVTFLQDYRSDIYHDQIVKTLDLVPEKSGWKIVAERSR